MVVRKTQNPTKGRRGKDNHWRGKEEGGNDCIFSPPICDGGAAPKGTKSQPSSQLFKTLSWAHSPVSRPFPLPLLPPLPPPRIPSLALLPPPPSFSRRDADLVILPLSSPGTAHPIRPLSPSRPLSLKIPGLSKIKYRCGREFVSSCFFRHPTPLLVLERLPAMARRLLEACLQDLRPRAHGSKGRAGDFPYLLPYMVG